MKKQEKQLINEWLKKFILDKPYGMLSGTWFEQFQKQHNLIDNELEVGKFYKNKFNENTILFIKAKTSREYEVYGLTDNNEWINSNYLIHEFNMEEAPESYVIERLKWYAENVMKYNHEKPNYKCLFAPKVTEMGNVLEYYLDEYGKFWVRFDNKEDYNLLMKDGIWAETFEVEDKNEDDFDKELFEQPNKPAYKSKGGEHGKKIIDKLVELKGINRYDCHGKDKDWFYFLNQDGEIDTHYELPQGYTECFLEEEKELCFDKKLDSEVAEFLEEFSKISGKVKPTKQRLFENNENAQTITIKLPKGVEYKIEVV